MIQSPKNNPAPPRLRLNLEFADDVEEIQGLTEQSAIERYIQSALAYAKRTQDTEISVRLVNEDEMAELNYQYRDKQGTTNVLAFPYSPPPELDIPLIGDLVICLPVLRQEADAQGKTIQQHFAHLVVHGTLHLLGYDHQTEQQALQMENAERDILNIFGIPDPYGEIAEQ